MTDHLDDLLGGALERAVNRHHRRRLRRLGQAGALSVSPTPGIRDGLDERPIREGCEVQVLVDGDQALAAVADALSGARSHVHIAGWHLTPEFRLRREPGTPVLRAVLADLSERVDVRVLLWAGPPLPLFQPTRPMMKEVQAQLMRGSNVQCVLDARERTMHCHHEKVIVIDDEIAFVGGIDLSDLSGDRWDHNDHPPRGSTGWHDVSTRLRGPIVADVAQHFRDRWQDVTGETMAAPITPGPVGDIAVRLLRTVPEKTYRVAPRGEFSILAAYVRALSSAQKFIYLENQFLWSTEIVDILGEKLRRPPHPDFRIVVVLPARPSNGADTTRGQLGRLLDADDGGGRLLAATVRAHAGGRPDPLYVHAKVGIVDDRWITIGSANLNEHSLLNDTEVNIVSEDEELARSTRLRLWAEHLECSESEVDGDPVTVIDARWKPIAQEQLARSAESGEANHRLVELAAVSRRTERLLGPVRGLLVDG